MKALILAGGQGLRLRPLTDDRPKPLVAVGGRPIAERQLDWLLQNVELEEAIFLCGYKWTKLKEHFGSDYKGVRIEYSVEESPLGTGGAFRKAIEGAGLADEDVVMMNGDIITELPLREMIEAHALAPSHPTVTILLVPYRSRFGIVHMDRRNLVTGFEEKPEFKDVWINGGIYVANAKKLLPSLPAKGDIERETFPELAASGQVLAHPFKGFWSLVDSIKDIQEVEKQLAPSLGRQK
ncbi:MAG TPA: nucleotidyltransferase family protein [Nitrososphaerales archaeon]|nr:nucleotidyltransferase family protein [Nitrososphaerales archaeon]